MPTAVAQPAEPIMRSDDAATNPSCRKVLSFLRNGPSFDLADDTPFPDAAAAMAENCFAQSEQWVESLRLLAVESSGQTTVEATPQHQADPLGLLEASLLLSEQWPLTDESDDIGPAFDLGGAHGANGGMSDFESMLALSEPRSRAEATTRCAPAVQRECLLSTAAVLCRGERLVLPPPPPLPPVTFMDDARVRAVRRTQPPPHTIRTEPRNRVEHRGGCQQQQLISRIEEAIESRTIRELKTLLAVFMQRHARLLSKSDLHELAVLLEETPDCHLSAWIVGQSSVTPSAKRAGESGGALLEPPELKEGPRCGSSVLPLVIEQQLLAFVNGTHPNRCQAWDVPIRMPYRTMAYSSARADRAFAKGPDKSPSSSGRD